ncbi:Vfa1p [Rhodotorula paludigena]|uniref:Vfa1p n=1 Tax=Rhodotorula paludigena TaxID=86838 RepID=UPI00317CD7BA
MASPAGSVPSPPPVASGSAASPAPSPGPPKLVNVYYKRTVATPKTCFICHRETTTCLATEGVSDFLYTCPSHLLDPGFARPAPSSSTPSAASSPAGSPAPSPVPRSEIDKVKQEYEDKQKRKAEGSDASKEGDDKGKKDDSAASQPASTAFALFKTGASALSSLSTTASSHLFPAPPPTAPSAVETARLAAQTARVFVLQRDYFRMRCETKRREWEKKDAKERGAAWSFPKAPKGGLPGA